MRTRNRLILFSAEFIFLMFCAAIGAILGATYADDRLLDGRHRGIAAGVGAGLFLMMATILICSVEVPMYLIRRHCARHRELQQENEQYIRTTTNLQRERDLEHDGRMHAEGVAVGLDRGMQHALDSQSRLALNALGQQQRLALQYQHSQQELFIGWNERNQTRMLEDSRARGHAEAERNIARRMLAYLSRGDAHPVHSAINSGAPSYGSGDRSQVRIEEVNDPRGSSSLLALEDSSAHARRTGRRDWF